MYANYGFRRSYTKSTQPRQVREVKTITRMDAWAAVAYADRTQGGEYLGSNSFVKEGQRRNKEIALEAIDNPSLVTEADREQAEILDLHFQGLMMKKLTVALNDFENTILKIIQKDAVTVNYDLAVMASLPASMRREDARKAKSEKVAIAGANSEYQGSVKDKITLPIKILSIFHSKNYPGVIVTAQSGTNLYKFFSSHTDAWTEGVEVTVQGTVKDHRVDGRTGSKETWLNRVKVK